MYTICYDNAWNDALLPVHCCLCTLEWCNKTCTILTLCLWMQTVMISAASVGWKKQGTCILVDNEPTPPTQQGFASKRGWKLVKDVQVSQGGGNWLFPVHQLMLVTGKGGAYKELKKSNQRVLSALLTTKHYLVWYHHLVPAKVLRAKQQSQK